MIRFDDGTQTAVAGAGTDAGSQPGRGAILLAGHGPATGALALALRGEGEQVKDFETFAAALEASVWLRPDTVIVGSDEAAGDALRFIYDVLGVNAGAAVIALTQGIDALETDLALAAGAHDVLPPPHSARAVLLRRHVIRRTKRIGRHTPGPGEIRPRVVMGHLIVDLASRQVMDGDDPLTLSGREFELLIRLMEARGEVVTRERLLHDIWGEDQGSEAVLDATVHRLRRRLEEKLPEADVVTTVRGIGYRLDAPRPTLSGTS